ncbi:hypothetical protein M9H77_30742 [Catharanthus roseus]|uniref:Uncharacterized protein n=1 Tax=Catharanthus roseus TaxID=4058 RepID=A0ACB9ZZY5_CATRO|nr:hypothetical protein M9H77_30742 [Catharanthus roseus]
MRYTWTNSSWQRMEAIGRQEMAYSKLTRPRSNCYKDGDYGGSAYGRSHHRDGNYTHRSQMGIGKFPSRAKTFDHIPYNNYGAYEGINYTYDYCENSPYEVCKGYHCSHEFSPTCLNYNINEQKEIYHGVRRPSIASLNASSSNVVRLLWLFEALDSRTNPFKERGMA